LVIARRENATAYDRRRRELHVLRTAYWLHVGHSSLIIGICCRQSMHSRSLQVSIAIIFVLFCRTPMSYHLLPVFLILTRINLIDQPFKYSSLAFRCRYHSFINGGGHKAFLLVLVFVMFLGCSVLTSSRVFWHITRTTKDGDQPVRILTSVLVKSWYGDSWSLDGASTVPLFHFELPHSPS